MVLSVIIVNYQVRYFLELCLHSVVRALEGIGAAEVIVVDNASGDGSVEALRPLFPAVRFIVNTENLGFARANNQGLGLAQGEFILFLNPDTVLAEDFASLCLDFLRATPRVGGLGVRMIDGSGRFLPESRRGFPSPWVAFTKLAGLSGIFPRSRVFASYYLGHLDAHSPHPAPVLSGACMLVRRAILAEVGGFDERFFMYAEDIDLSYRLEQAGYVNYYFPGATIVHFKGESTRKDARYIRLFYKAMSQFRRKHFRRGLPAVFNIFMEAAIWVRVGFGKVFGRREEVGGAKGDLRFRVEGDAAEAARVRELLGARASAGGSAVILCEGPGFSFRECIAAVEKGGPGRILLHAAGSNSAVGSVDRAGRGETLVF